VAMPITPFVSKNPLRFRGLSDSLAASHLEASECCLIHADNPLSTSKPILLNPNVIVGYNGSAYEAMHSPEAFMSPFYIFRATWENRLRRLFTLTWLKEWKVRQIIAMWMDHSGETELGEFCTINEMQVIYERGWKHV
jgi:hypothetical protein